jgi:SpoVK/Ycf46/Vps4 family AAA+-type ATPase
LIRLLTIGLLLPLTHSLPNPNPSCSSVTRPCLLPPRGNFDLSSGNGHSAGGGDDNSSEAGVVSRILSTFLNELDGISSASSLLSFDSSSSSSNALNRVFVIAACSDSNTLDKALLRPGRLSHQITLFPPSRHDLRELFRQSLSLIPVSAEMCYDRLVELYCNQEGLEGEDDYNSAEVIAICHEAIQLAVNENIQILQRKAALGEKGGGGEEEEEEFQRLQMHHFESILLSKQKKTTFTSEFKFETDKPYAFC